MRRILCTGLLSLAAITSAQASVVGDVLTLHDVFIDGAQIIDTQVSSLPVAQNGSMFNTATASFSFFPTTLEVAFNTDNVYSQAVFNGWSITNESNSFEGAYSLVSSSLASFCVCRVSTIENKLYLNFQGLETHTGDKIVFAMTPLAAVPEPETYAMLLAGLGLVAGIARRRRKPAIA